MFERGIADGLQVRVYCIGVSDQRPEVPEPEELIWSPAERKASQKVRCKRKKQKKKKQCDSGSEISSSVSCDAEPSEMSSMGPEQS